MFEMFATIVAACAAAIYVFHDLFLWPAYIVTFTAPHLSVLSLSYMLLTVFIIIIKFRRIKKLHVDFDDYLYYDKYTSPLYRAGYFISYLIQNILFDYTYMKRNF